MALESFDLGLWDIAIQGAAGPVALRRVSSWHVDEAGDFFHFVLQPEDEEPAHAVIPREHLFLMAIAEHDPLADFEDEGEQSLGITH